jgi:hypothetical protein
MPGPVCCAWEGFWGMTRRTRRTRELFSSIPLIHDRNLFPETSRNNMEVDEQNPFPEPSPNNTEVDEQNPFPEPSPNNTEVDEQNPFPEPSPENMEVDKDASSSDDSSDIEWDAEETGGKILERFQKSITVLRERLEYCLSFILNSL